MNQNNQDPPKNSQSPQTFNFIVIGLILSLVMNFLSEATGAELDKEVLSIIEACHKKAAGLLAENKAALQKISEYLVSKETISGEEFMRILGEQS